MRSNKSSASASVLIQRFRLGLAFEEFGHHGCRCNRDRTARTLERSVFDTVIADTQVDV
jgi:hypothetical protein